MYLVRPWCRSPCSRPPRMGSRPPRRREGEGTDGTPRPPRRERAARRSRRSARRTNRAVSRAGPCDEVTRWGGQEAGGGGGGRMRIMSAVHDVHDQSTDDDSTLVRSSILPRYGIRSTYKTRRPAHLHPWGHRRSGWPVRTGRRAARWRVSSRRSRHARCAVVCVLRERMMRGSEWVVR